MIHSLIVENCWLLKKGLPQIFAFPGLTFAYCKLPWEAWTSLDLKKQFTQLWKFCHQLLTLMSFHNQNPLVHVLRTHLTSSNVLA